MAKLCVNVDHVATVRQARRTVEPDPVWAAVQAELGGAVGITVHLREDRRHIQDRDVHLLRKTVRGKLNLEMAAVEEMLRFALEVRPDQATLVPEKREEVTTEGGLDAAGQENRLKEYVSALRKGGIQASLFIDPDPKQVSAAARLGADFIEVNTGAYSEAKTSADLDREFEAIRAAVLRARKELLGVHAGHGLTYLNVQRIAALPQLSELNIGHSIVSRAILTGMERAVRDMVALLERAPAGRESKAKE
ncbi:MAG: pyridoxine 5'-phosphate synthase [Candidatus Tectomicrobia bacterium]|nr:pyridoxine 5'-phosphate synthase [Candidatus Tectomicrobia bacterium]